MYEITQNAQSKFQDIRLMVFTRYGYVTYKTEPHY